MAIKIKRRRASGFSPSNIGTMITYFVIRPSRPPSFHAKTRMSLSERSGDPRRGRGAKALSPKVPSDVAISPSLRWGTAERAGSHYPLPPRRAPFGLLPATAPRHLPQMTGRCSVSRCPFTVIWGRAGRGCHCRSTAWICHCEEGVLPDEAISFLSSGAGLNSHILARTLRIVTV